MLYWLAEYLQDYVRGFAVFQYLTLRAILGVLTALGISLLLGPWVIRRLNEMRIGQAVRTDGPQSHLSKSGTPTTGGALILTAIFISTLLWADLSNRYIWVAMIVTLVVGAVGWVDDYRKVALRDSRGLPGHCKYFCPSVAGLGAASLFGVTSTRPAETPPCPPRRTNVALELAMLDLGCTCCVIAGSSHAVSRPDGLDGLAIMPSVMLG